MVFMFVTHETYMLHTHETSESEVHTIELVQGNPCPRSSLVKEFASCQAATVLSWSGMVCLDNLAHQKVGAGSWNFWQWSSRLASEAQNHSVICSLSALEGVDQVGEKEKIFIRMKLKPPMVSDKLLSVDHAANGFLKWIHLMLLRRPKSWTLMQVSYCTGGLLLS